MVEKVNNHFKFGRTRNFCKKKNLTFIYGQSRRKSQLQREYELHEDWLNKLNTYEKHLEIMGEGNSYSRTDQDATFMRMKEDHMRNGQLKPVYNIQCATNGVYVIGIESFSNLSDMTTLIPFLKKINNLYYIKIKRIYVSSNFDKLRKKSEENVNSLEGKEELINRSIQAEGIFSYIKSEMKYNRFNYRGKMNIVS